jgi:membrane protein implicated in regulation of membrane protease activity
MFGLDFNTLNCVYFSLFFVGIGYAIFILITGGLSSIDLPDVDIDIPQIDLPGDVDIPGAGIHIGEPALPAAGIDAPDVSVSPLSPITIATFITVFGGAGVISNQLFDIDPRMSLLWATVAGVLCSALMFLFYSQFLIRSQASSEVRVREIVGLQAEVTVPIGESTPGQVAYPTKVGRMSAMARSVDGNAIPRGQFVRIVRTMGSQVLVELLPRDAEEEA